MKSASLVFAVSVVGAALLGPVASAAPLSFLNGTITSRFPAKELPAFRAAVGDVLNNAKDGATTQWSSAQASSRRGVQVALTPLQTVQTGKASTCRLLDAQVRQASASEKWQFWFCKQADGSWKASGSNTPG